MDNMLALLNNARELSMRDKVVLCENEMKKMPQLELRVEHYFSLGIYARELYIPKDTILVGKIHKFPQLNILASGDISVLVDDQIKRLQAPLTIASPAGSKRIAYAHENTVWITVHGTHETDLELIEDHFIAQSENEYIEFCNKQLLLQKNYLKEPLQGQIEHNGLF